MLYFSCTCIYHHAHAYIYIYIYLHTPSKGIYSTNFYQSFQILLANTHSHESVHTHVMQWQLLYMWPDEVSQLWCHHALVEGHIPNSRVYYMLCALTGGPSLHVYVAIELGSACIDCMYDEHKTQALGFMINLSSHYNKTNFEAVQGWVDHQPWMPIYSWVA